MALDIAQLQQMAMNPFGPPSGGFSVAPVRPRVTAPTPRVPMPRLRPAMADQGEPPPDAVSAPAATATPPAANRPSILRGPTGDFISNLAAGMGAIPEDAGPVVSFGRAFSGAVGAGQARRASAAERAQQEEERTYQRGRDTKSDSREERRLQLEEEKAARESEGDYVDSEFGPIHSKDYFEIEQRVASYASSLKLENLFGEARDKALQDVRDYRRELQKTFAKKDKGQGADQPAQPTGGASVVPPRPSIYPQAQPAPAVTPPPAAVSGGQTSIGVNPADQQRMQAAPGGVGIKRESTEITKPAAQSVNITGTGTQDSPITGFPAQMDAPTLENFQKAVPIGGYYVIVDPATGQPQTYRRTR